MNSLIYIFFVADFKNTGVERWEFDSIIRLLAQDSTMSGSSEFTSSQVRTYQSLVPSFSEKTTLMNNKNNGPFKL